MSDKDVALYMYKGLICTRKQPKVEAILSSRNMDLLEQKSTNTPAGVSSLR